MISEPIIQLHDMATGVALAEVPLAGDSTVVRTVNDFGEATLQVDYAHSEVFPLLAPWASQVVLWVDGRPHWCGVVAKRRGSFGQAAGEVIALEWGWWLSRVSIPGDYSAAALDAGSVVAYRIRQAQFKAALLGGLVPPIVALDSVSGVQVSVEWNEDGFGLSNPTVWDNIGEVIEQGVDVRIEPVARADGSMSPTLVVAQFAPNALTAPTWVVGDDISDAVLIEDSDLQVTQWQMDGDGEGVAYPTTSMLGGLPLLERVRTLPTVDNPAEMARRAALLWPMAKTPAVTLDEAKIDSGALRDVPVPGEDAQFYIPPGLDSRLPSGLTVMSRVESVTYNLGVDDSDVQLTLTQPWDTSNTRSGDRASPPRRPNRIFPNN